MTSPRIIGMTKSASGRSKSNSLEVDTSMVMEKIEKVEQPYKAQISKETLERWGEIRVWDQPMSAVEGAQVKDSIKEVIGVTVVEEQKGLFGTIQRVKVRYAKDKEGWVLWEAVKKQ